MKKTDYLLIISLSCLSIVSMNPFFIWGENRLYYVIFLLLSLFGFILSCQKKINYLTSFSLITFVFVYHYLNGASLLGCCAFSMSTVLIYNLSIKQAEKTFLIFSLFYAVLLIPGLFLWGIHGLTGHNYLLKLGSISTNLIPSHFKVLMNEGYSLYPGAIILDYMEKDRIYRFMGVFDEPGVVGTISGLILISSRFNLKTWISKIIFISGLISFSLAFYLLSVLYLIFIILFRFQKYKKKIILLGIILLFSIAGEFAHVRILSRAGITLNYDVEKNKIADIKIHGDNRGNVLLENKFIEWTNSKGLNLFLGFREGDFQGASSWKQIPIKTGAIGVILLIGILLMFVSRYLNFLTLEFLIFFSIFVLSIYQRPDVLTPVLLLILIYGILINSRQSEIGIINQQFSLS